MKWYALIQRSFVEIRCFGLLETFLLGTVTCKAQVVLTAWLQMICQP